MPESATTNMSEPRHGPGPLALLRPHWRVTLAAFLGWFLDAFDQVVLLLALPDIGRSLGATLTAMGLVITAQSVGRRSATPAGAGSPTATAGS